MEEVVAEKTREVHSPAYIDSRQRNSRGLSLSHRFLLLDLFGDSSRARREIGKNCLGKETSLRYSRRTIERRGLAPRGMIYFGTRRSIFARVLHYILVLFFLPRPDIYGGNRNLAALRDFGCARGLSLQAERQRCRVWSFAAVFSRLEMRFLFSLYTEYALLSLKMDYFVI